MSILGDPLWDTKCFPSLDPKMENHMNADREVRLTHQQFIEQRLLNVNTRFADCKSFLYAMCGYIEMKQLTNNISISMQRGKKQTREDGKTEMKLDRKCETFLMIKAW